MNKPKLRILAAYQWPLLGAPDLEARVNRSAAQSIVSAYQAPAADLASVDDCG